MFGVDLTWLGWTYVVLAWLGILVYFFQGATARTAEVTFIKMFAMLLLVLFQIGFFTIGFTH